MKTNKKLFKRILSLGILVTFFLLPVIAAQSEEIDGIFVQEKPVKETAKPHKSLDAFTIAFFGLSVGCMFIISSIHWTMSRRKHIINEITILSSFISKNSSVTLTISGFNGTNPIEEAMKRIGEDGDAKLRNLEEERNTAIKTAARVETELLKIWG